MEHIAESDVIDRVGAELTAPTHTAIFNQFAHGSYAATQHYYPALDRHLRLGRDFSPDDGEFR